MDMHGLKMILSMSAIELAHRSAVNGLGLEFYRPQLLHENQAVHFVQNRGPSCNWKDQTRLMHGVLTMQTAAHRVYSISMGLGRLSCKNGGPKARQTRLVTLNANSAFCHWAHGARTIDRLAGSGAPSIGSRHLLSYPTTNICHMGHSEAAQTGFVTDMHTTWSLAVTQIDRPCVVLTQL